MSRHRFSLYIYESQVGNQTKIDELKIISNSESNLFLVGDYKALEGILSKLKTSIIKGIEGNTKRL